MTKERSTTQPMFLGWGWSAGLSLGFSLSMGLLGGCLPSGPKENETPPAPPTVENPENLSAKQYFNANVQALLNSTCGACHSREVGVGPGFLRSASVDPTVYDPYPITSSWNGFIGGDPELSGLLTKGQHEGPALTISQYDTVLTWLKKEKSERDAVTVIPFHPQLPPQVLVLSSGTTTTDNIFDLSKLDSSFIGAEIRFVAKTLNANGNGLELSNLRIVNTKTNPVPMEQRSIHFKSPLFVLWRSTVPYPDPGTSFDGYDRTVPLNPTDTTKVGTPLGPGILVLDQYQPGYSISVVFDVIELVKPVAGANPCTTTQYNYFKNNIALHYLGATMAGNPITCSRAGACHNTVARAAEIDMAPAATGPGANLTALCEQMKFYNALGIIARNTDPNQNAGHAYKWTTAECNNLTPPEGAGCFATFSSLLDTWRNTQ